MRQSLCNCNASSARTILYNKCNFPRPNRYGGNSNCVSQMKRTGWLATLLLRSSSSAFEASWPIKEIKKRTNKRTNTQMNQPTNKQNECSECASCIQLRYSTTITTSPPLTPMCPSHIWVFRRGTQICVPHLIDLGRFGQGTIGCTGIIQPIGHKRSVVKLLFGPFQIPRKHVLCSHWGSKLFYHCFQTILKVTGRREITATTNDIDVVCWTRFDTIQMIHRANAFVSHSSNHLTTGVSSD